MSSQVPHFLIIGERRSGTSTLSKWMEAHPDLYFQPHLDMGTFLDPRIRRRTQWFDGHIDLKEWETEFNFSEYKKLFITGANKIVIGEKSADYLFWEPSHSRIFKFLPEVKLIAVLRNPVDRAWSHYWNEVGKGRENLSFEQAVKIETARTENSDYAKCHLSYIERGLYYQSLQRLYKTFDCHNVHLVLLDDMKNNPLDTLKGIYRFIGLEDNQGLEYAGKVFNHNWTTVPKGFWTGNSTLKYIESQIYNLSNFVAKRIIRDSYKRKRLQPKIHSLTRLAQKDFKMNEGVRKEISKLFLQDIEKLETTLQRDLTNWK